MSGIHNIQTVLYVKNEAKYVVLFNVYLCSNNNIGICSVLLAWK